MSDVKYVYSFGGGTADGEAKMKNLLGGKGANLAEMASLGIPVPAGFTLTTEVCTYYYDHGRTYPSTIEAEVDAAMAKVEKVMGTKFGDPEDALLVSVRSGARSSMPGMMETVLNVGLCSATIPGLIAKTGNARFVYDAYRRLIMMYSDVVMEKAAGIEPDDTRMPETHPETLFECRRRHGLVGDPRPVGDDLGHRLVHRHCRAEDAGTRVGDIGQFEHALDRAVLAERSVQQRQHDGAFGEVRGLAQQAQVVRGVDEIAAAIAMAVVLLGGFDHRCRNIHAHDFPELVTQGLAQAAGAAAEIQGAFARRFEPEFAEIGQGGRDLVAAPGEEGLGIPAVSAGLPKTQHGPQGILATEVLVGLADVLERHQGREVSDGTSSAAAA